MNIAETTPGRQQRVLIVDDEPLMARALAYALFEYDVEVARSVHEAFDKLATATFDAIVTDLHLPGDSGMVLHERLVRTNPGAAGRTIFTTGGCSDGEMEALNAFGRPCLLKPFDIEELRHMIARVSSSTKQECRE